MGFIYRGITAFTPKIANTAVNKIYRGSLLLWENWIYDTTNRYGAYYGGGYPVGLDITTGVDITIKNPTIRIWGYCSNGEGETSDRRVMYCYGKRTDGTWDTLSYSAHENDITHGSDTFDYSFTVSNGYLYNQFRYTLAGMGQNWYQMDCYVDACYHQ